MRQKRPLCATVSAMIQLTLRLKLRPTPEQKSIFYTTSEQHTQSYNYACNFGWKNSTANRIEIHHGVYRAQREATQLPSQLVVSSITRASESLASAKALRRKKKKVACPKSKLCPIRYDSRSSTVNLKEGFAALATVSGRQRVQFKVPDFQLPYIDWKVCSSDLIRNRKGNYFLHVVVSREEEPFIPVKRTVGVDLGITHPAVTSKNKFLGKRSWKNVERRNFKLRRSLQAKGTKSAKRHLQKLSGRQKRFRRDCDRVLSKQLVQSCKKGSTLVFENLKEIRSGNSKGKRFNRKLHGWSFDQLQAFVEYKAKMRGIQVVYVDPRYTSQKCSKCKFRSKKNRISQSSFQCRSCGFRIHADLNAARNIRKRYLFTQAKSLGNGLMSTSLVQRSKDHLQAACFGR